MRLSERIAAADGPSVDLDHDISRMILNDRPLLMKPYTASLDTAVALFREVLPGWGFDLCSPSEENSGVFVCLYPPDVDAETVWSFDDDQPTHNHLALALCTAIAKAKGV